MRVCGFGGAGVAGAGIFGDGAGTGFGAGPAFGGERCLGFSLDPIDRGPDRFQIEVDTRAMALRPPVQVALVEAIVVAAREPGRLEIGLV